jgi:uncharacterized protein
VGGRGAAPPRAARLERAGFHAPALTLLPGLDLASPSGDAVAVVYAHGRFPEMLRLRLHDYLSDFTPLAGARVTLGAVAGYAAYYAQLAGLFLVGVWAERRDLPARLAARGRWARALCLGAGLAAALLTVLRYAVLESADALYYYQGEALALFYVASFALALPALGGRERAFQAVGRMSLTAYLAHTILASLLLYGTGLGLYGRIGPAALLPLALACYALLAAACVAWLRRFRLGPAEWLWRSLHHGRWEALRR